MLRRQPEKLLLNAADVLAVTNKSAMGKLHVQKWCLGLHIVPMKEQQRM